MLPKVACMPESVEMFQSLIYFANNCRCNLIY